MSYPPFPCVDRLIRRCVLSKSTLSYRSCLLLPETLQAVSPSLPSVPDSGDGDTAFIRLRGLGGTRESGRTSVEGQPHHTPRGARTRPIAMWVSPPQLRPGAGGAPCAPPHTQGPRYGLSLPAPLPAESVLLLSYSIEATSRRFVFARGDDKAPCSENHPHLPLLSEAMSLPSGERHSRCEGIPCRATGLGIHAVPGKIFFRCKPQRKIFPTPARNLPTAVWAA